MPYGSPGEGRKLFETHYALVEEIIRYLARRHQLTRDEREDFTSYALLKLVDNDYAQLRQYRGDASVKTYLTVVLQRLFLDYRTHKWGRWRPSAQAVRLGDLAVRLETLLYRDGHDFRAAREILGKDEDPELLWTLASRLPRRERHRRLELEEEALLEMGARQSDDFFDRDDSSRRVHWLERSLQAESLELRAEDRMILRMRYDEGMSVGAIAAALHLPVKPLYSRISRLLKRLREKLESRGVRWDSVSDVVGRRDTDLNLERVFAEPSNPVFVSV